MATLLGAAPVGFAVLDSDLRYVRVNDYLAEINGLPAVEHVGRTLREVVPGLADEAEAAFGRVLAGGEPLRELELSGDVASSPGLRRHWTASVYPVPDRAGRPAVLAVIVFEATRRVEAEQAKADTAALLDLLLMRAPIGIAFLDDELRYVRINEKLAAANGIAVVDHLGRSVQEMLPEVAPDVVPLLRSVLATGQPLIGLPVQTGATPAESGRRRHWSVSYYPVRHSNQGMPEGLGLIVVDDTDRVEADVERERLIEAHRTSAVTATAALERLERLHQLTSALAAASTVDQVAATAVTLASHVLQAGAATLSVHADGLTVRVLASIGMPPADEVDQDLAGLQVRWAQQVLAGAAAVLVPNWTDPDRRPPHNRTTHAAPTTQAAPTSRSA